MNLKKGDKVIVISGKDKGKQGTVDKVFPAENRILVSGVNLRKVHQRPRKSGEIGQIIEKNMPIHASNAMLLDGGSRTRTAKKFVDGRMIRVSKKSGNAI